MSSNPYAAPKAKVADDAQAAPSPLWNPNAAGLWSLPFSPAFGAYLHMLNWRALGDEQRAAGARRWFLVGVGLLVVYLVLSVVALRGWPVANVLSQALSLGFLIAWYFASARGQVTYVKEQYGDGYERRPWGKPLGIAVGLMVVYFVVSIAAGFAFGPGRGG